MRYMSTTTDNVTVDLSTCSIWQRLKASWLLVISGAVSVQASGGDTISVYDDGL